MKLFRPTAAVALLLCAFSSATRAGDAGTVYTQLGTNGLGLGYATSIGNDWALRGQLNAYQRSFTGDVGDFGPAASLKLDLNLSSLQVVGDWYPGDSGFRLSGGLVLNNNKVSMTGTNATVGTQTGVNVDGEIKLSETISPYVGLGYSTKPKDARGFGFNMDLGVMFQNPKISLHAPGASQADIDAQLLKVQDSVNKLKAMPVLGVGMSYSF
jgi:hypothetical protein